jgi:RNA-directed DNA polymerase
MTAARSAGATSHLPMDWHQINWHAVHRNARRLQARIVQATQGGRWGKVHALPHRLTHAFSGKALAVRRVTDNQGKRTPGVDGETWSTPSSEDDGHRRTATTGLSSPPAAARVYSQKEWHEAPLGHPDDP